VRTTARIALLVALWLLAWGDITIANVLSGIALAALILVAFPLGERSDARIHVSGLGIVRLVMYVARQLVVSNVLMARQILRRRLAGPPGVLAHRLREPSDAVVTVMTSIISLSPGTMTVDVTSDSSTVYVHFFDLRDIDQARASLTRLEALVTGAISAPRGAAVRNHEEQTS
jgi:multicomponent Na+:H+ antiporter subunit E